MKDLYEMIGISKQAHYKRVASIKERLAVEQEIITSAELIRRTHRRMGCRKLYAEIAPKRYGRDKTEQLLLANGFRLTKKKNYTKTTRAGVHRFNNLISGKDFTDVNQLWVSDITYIPYGYKNNYYLTLILDVYSRLIVGWSLSQTMTAQDTVYCAYKMAVKQRNCNLKGLIFHSDRGSQYGSDLVQQMHNKHKVIPSMGNKAWENAHAESLNGILKNEYIILPNEVKYTKAIKMVARWIKLYNQDRPHGSLENSKPKKYENFLLGLAPKEKPIVTINY